MLSVGGHNHKAQLEDQEKHLLILPAGHHIATLLVQHYHDQVAYQGHHITKGALHTDGGWIVGVRRLVSSITFKFVICRKLRDKSEVQKMSDLPAESMAMNPPFTM